MPQTAMGPHGGIPKRLRQGEPTKATMRPRPFAPHRRIGERRGGDKETYRRHRAQPARGARNRQKRPLLKKGACRRRWDRMTPAEAIEPRARPSGRDQSPRTGIQDRPPSPPGHGGAGRAAPNGPVPKGASGRSTQRYAEDHPAVAGRADGRHPEGGRLEPDFRPRRWSGKPTRERTGEPAYGRPTPDAVEWIGRRGYPTPA